VALYVLECRNRRIHDVALMRSYDDKIFAEDIIRKEKRNENKAMLWETEIIQ